MNTKPSLFARTFGTYLALMVLLVITYGAAHLDLGLWNTPVSLFIATVKAGLVVVFFMHLGRERGVSKVAAVVGVVWLAILVALVLSDELSRGLLLLPGHWP